MNSLCDAIIPEEKHGNKQETYVTTEGQKPTYNIVLSGHIMKYARTENDYEESTQN